MSLLIENADATPPHLEVTLLLGSSDGVQSSLLFFAIFAEHLPKGLFHLPACTQCPAYLVGFEL